MGTTSDGNEFAARFNPDHQYFAMEIVRKVGNPGIIKTVKWELNVLKSFDGYPFIATDSTYEVIHTKYSLNDHFVIAKADFTKPDEALLTYDWHKPCLQIFYSRMGSDKCIIYRLGSLSPGITSSQLLAMIKQQLTKRAKMHIYNNLFLCTIVAGLAVTIRTISIFALKRNY